MKDVAAAINAFGQEDIAKLESEGTIDTAELESIRYWLSM
jgi:hypothetical protein